MDPILFLCHRIPYPPNKGDKIRSYNLLLALSRRYQVHLGCFIDDAADWQYLPTLERLCASVHCEPLKPLAAYARGATSLLSGRPITVPFYTNSKLQRWVDDTVASQHIQRGLVFSSSMAQYLDHPQFAGMRRVIDFVDVDSNKWAQYAEQKTGIARWIYQREHHKLQGYENQIAASFDYSLLVSSDEAKLFQQQLPTPVHAKVAALSNGVDTLFFDPTAQTQPEEVGTAPYICFTGAMDYWANVDAVVWFAQHVWPIVHAQRPELRFKIVGGKPTKAVQQLTQIAGVEVTGRVEDIRPYITRSDLVVAPMRIARGIQNKVLEAMALGKPIVATTMAMEGIGMGTDLCIKVTDEAKAFAHACLTYLQHRYDAPPITNRAWVVDHFSWQSTLAELPTYFEGEAV